MNAARTLQQEAGLSPLMARLLHLRGVQTPGEADSFLNPGPEAILDPFLFSEMDAAVDRIQHAIEAGQRILIHGDYDVDGITSSAIMLETLRELGAETSVFLPNRLTDSYGLQSEAMPRFAEQADLLITVDCGTTAVDAIEEARRLGLDVIVTDHHDPGPERPPALAVLNPMRDEERYPSQCLSGAGVAWKLACALRQSLLGEDGIDSQLELAALGMVADVMPLTGENRAILKRALPRFADADRPGLSALLEVAKIAPARVTATDIGFRLGPRLNAAGRLEDPMLALELLITPDEARAQELAQTLQQLNQKRQGEERKMIDAACKRIEAEGLLDRSDKLLFIAESNWPRGVIGLAASRLARKYNRSAFVLTIENDEAHGSARAADGHNLIPLLDQARPHARSCGGHEAAAGMRVETARLDDFAEALYQAAEEHCKTPASRSIWVDAPLPLERVNEDWMGELNRLEPFGQGNDEPVFFARARLNGYGARVVGNNHLQATFEHPRGSIASIGFGMGDKLELLNGGGEIELLFHCRHDEYQGRKDIKLHLVDLRPAETSSISTASEESTASDSDAAPAQNNEANTREANETAYSISPVMQQTVQLEVDPANSSLDRESLGTIYRLLTKCADEQKRIRRENAWLLAKLQKVSEDDFNLALQIFSEIGLLRISDVEIELVEASEKKDLSSSPTFKRIGGSQ